MQTLLHLVSSFNHLMAFAGGGGSGGGFSGGGGGYHSGGSHSGSGSGAAGNVLMYLMIGMFSTLFITRWWARHYTLRGALHTGIVVGIAATVGFFFASPLAGAVAMVGAGIGLGSGLSDVAGKFKRKFFKGGASMELAASKDSAWEETAVQERVRQVFYDYQKDWTDFNVQHMQSYLEPHYYQHAELMLAALKQMGRQNLVDNPELLSIDAVEVVDLPDNTQDQFSVRMAGRGNDQLIETATGKQLYGGVTNFWELWRFTRDGNTWDLAGIRPYTADGARVDVALERFAGQNGMFYSLDWGRLLLPQRGQLFSRAGFRNSDVNNHVIGQWNDLIVQMYTYVPYNGSVENYLVAQIALPKSYGGILVRRRGAGDWRTWFLFAPRGYKRVSMEWPDFNKRYKVFATDVDQVTSFELLNPKFMADLYDKELPFSIEVVDNVAYLYAPITGMSVSGSYARYTAALNVLQAAHKELYM